MTSVQRWSRVVIGMALLLMVPAYFAVRLHLDTEHAARTMPDLEAALDDAIAVIERRDLTCLGDGPRPELLPVRQATDLIGSAAARAHDLNKAYNDDDVLWLLKSGLPVTERARTFRQTAGPLQDYLAGFRERVGTACRGRWYSETELNEDEVRGQKELADGLVALREQRARLATAWEALDGQRPVLGAVAWSLGLLELVGWGLLFVNLPRDLRALRAKRAQRRGKEG